MSAAAASTTAARFASGGDAGRPRAREVGEGAAAATAFGLAAFGLAAADFGRAGAGAEAGRGSCGDALAEPPRDDGRRFVRRGAGEVPPLALAEVPPLAPAVDD